MILLLWNLVHLPLDLVQLLVQRRLSPGSTRLSHNKHVVAALSSLDVVRELLARLIIVIVIHGLLVLVNEAAKE